jgi:AraC-like DNA-binding protein
VTERSTVELTTDGQRANITQHVRPGAPRGAILTEYLFASFVLRGARAAGKSLRVRHVSLAHESPESAPYEELFGAPVSFGAPLDTLVLDHADLALPLATADAMTAALLEERALAMSRALVPTDPFLDQVRQGMLARLRESRDQTIDGLSRALALSSRTLQRRLEERGTSHRELLDEVRCTIAKHLLGEGKSAAEVAYEVCFATPQAFHKAFLRWTGNTPGEARKVR